jgi:hypothetical protein
LVWYGLSLTTIAGEFREAIEIFIPQIFNLHMDKLATSMEMMSQLSEQGMPHICFGMRLC